MVISGLLAGAAGGATVSIVIRAVDKFSKTFTQANANLAKLGTAMTAVGIAGAFAVGGLIKMAGQFEQTTIAFTTMLGDAEEAKKLLKDLADFAAKTPFTIPGIEASAKQLLAMGIEVDDLLPTLKSLGDISAGLNVPLSRLALNFGQVSIQGKLTGRELRDFAIAGVPLVSELAKNLGVAEKEIASMVSRGDIGFELVAEAFKSMSSEGGKFFNLMDEQSKTFLGQVSNIKDSFIKIGRVMGEVFLPAAKWVAEYLAIIVGWFEEHPTVAKFAAVVLAVGTGLLLILGPLFMLIAFLPFLIAGFGALTFVTLPLTLAILAIAAGITATIAAGVLLWKNWDTMSKKTKVFMTVLAPLAAFPIKLIKEWDRMKIAMAKIWNSIVRSTEWGLNKIIGFINTLIRGYNAVASVLGFGTISQLSKVSFGGALIDISALRKEVEMQKEITKEIEKQTDVSKELEAKVAKLAGYKLIAQTGDVFRPGAFTRAEFESEWAYRQAKLGGGVNITIENVIGLDPEEISRALSDELNSKLSL